MKTFRTGLVLTAALVAQGCSSSNDVSPTVASSSSDAGAGEASSTVVDSGADTGAPSALTIQLSGTALDVSPGSTPAPISGVKVCLLDANGAELSVPPCTSSDATGAFALAGLPQNEQLSVGFTKSGYGSELVPVDAKAANIPMTFPVELASLATLPQYWVGSGVIQDTTLGTLDFGALTPTASGTGGDTGTGFDFTLGVVVTLSPANGAGPLYLDKTQKFVSGAKSTAGGVGAYLNLPGGRYTVSFASTTASCNGLPGYAAGYPAGAGAVTVPVVVGYETQLATAICVPSAGATSGDAAAP